ncbi:hypothetical protein N6P31_02775 [Pectobacterium betavasculorum]|nr:hypothetical protein [Pectobacterium betavasculorum]
MSAFVDFEDDAIERIHLGETQCADGLVRGWANHANGLQSCRR